VARPTRSRWLAVAVSLVGLSVCVAGIVAFVLEVMQNTLPWSPSQSIRDHYLAVGQSYSEGFLSGFFLCLFLMLVAVVVTGVDRPQPQRERSRHQRS